MTITQDSRRIHLSFAFNPKVLEDVKAINGRQYDRETKTWSVPLSEAEAVDKLRKKYHYLLPAATSPEVVGSIPELPELQVQVPLKRQPYPYQQKGIARGLQLRRFINGDQPGLGKTGQAICTIETAYEGLKEAVFPCLIICPTSLKENWRREWEIWTNRRAVVMADGIKTSWPQYLKMGMVDVYITNYESLKKYFVSAINKPKDAPLTLKHVVFRPEIALFRSVIIDEIHKCKDSGTQQAKFAKGICAGKEWVLGLTGTPVVNKPKDLLSQLSIINRLPDLGGYKNFMTRYCGGNGSGATNLRELQYKLATTCFFQRQKKEVLKDLPDKVRQIILCDITTRKEYQDALSDLAGYLKEYREKSEEQVEKSMRGELMVKIGICKNISARGKLNEVREYIDEIVDAGEKVVVFIHQKEIAKALYEAYPHAVSVTGADSPEQRQVAVDRFQKDAKCQVIICNIKAGGVGITLTAASRVAFVEMPWHAADADQCEDRCHRIGQKDSVQCTYFLGAGTIDEDIYKIIEKKREVANTITGSSDDVQKEIIDRIADSLFNGGKK